MISGNKLKTITSRVTLMLGTLLLLGCNQEISISSKYISDGFDFPVGKPYAKGYYDAQPYGKNNHLGSDWNGKGGGNSDLGDNIYSVSNGYVKSAKNIGGDWGNVIRIIHKLPNGKTYESIYAHCNEIAVKPKSWVKRGQRIGTIGSNKGMYYAHLHFEIRNEINMRIGRGYSYITWGYLNPTKFIKSHRKL